MISPEDGKALLIIVRAAVEAKLLNLHAVVDEKFREKFSAPRGVWVTILEHDKPVSSAGILEPMKSMIDALIESAVKAALKKDEKSSFVLSDLPNIRFEINILSTPKLIHVQNAIDANNSIKIGTDGIIVRESGEEGVILPQEAINNDWNAIELLEQTSERAGLDHNAWRRATSMVDKFQVETFIEESGGSLPLLSAQEQQYRRQFGESY